MYANQAAARLLFMSHGPYARTWLTHARTKTLLWWVQTTLPSSPSDMRLLCTFHFWSKPQLLTKQGMSSFTPHGGRFKIPWIEKKKHNHSDVFIKESVSVSGQDNSNKFGQIDSDKEISPFHYEGPNTTSPPKSALIDLLEIPGNSEAFWEFPGTCRKTIEWRRNGREMSSRIQDKRISTMTTPAS